MAMGAATTAVAMAMVVGLADVGLAVAAGHAIAVHPGQDAGEEEHSGVHDAEGEAGLEHGAGLVDGGVDAGVEGGAPEGAERDGDRVAHRHRGAVRVRHDAHAVGGPDEGSHEQQVHEPHAPRVRRRPVVAEERPDRPGESQRRHDEHHQVQVRR